MRQASDKVYVCLVCVVLVLATFAAFEPVRHNEFVNYDDDDYVTENPQVTGGISWESMVWAFTSSHVGNWHPVTWLSHMLDCEFFGLEPPGHHLVNLLFHLVNTLLLFAVLKRMTGVIWRSAFVAAVFALHPLHVESVAWVSERKDVLSTLFWLLTMAAYLRYVNRQGGLGWYLLALLAFAVGLMAKPMLVTLPFVLLLLDYWPLGRFQNGQIAEDSGDRNRKHSFFYLVREKVPFFVLAALGSVVTFLVERGGGSVASKEWIPVTVRVSNASISCVKYMIKMVWPSRLAVLYPHPHKVFLLPAVLSALLLVAITIAIIYAGRRHKYLPAGWLWYLGTLVPVIGLVQVGGQALADRYTYVPLTGLFIIIAWGVPELLAKWRYRKIILAFSAIAVIIALSICTHRQVCYWRDSKTLFQHALDVTENNGIMLNNFGDALRREGHPKEAIAYFDEALRINPQHYLARSNKARVLTDLGRVDEAIAIFTELLRVKKDWPDPHNYLGLAYAKKGNYDLAVQSYNRALQLKPAYFRARNNLGVAKKKQGKINEAVQMWEKALQLAPDYPNAHYNMALAMAEEGKYHDAIEHLNRALTARPDWAEAHYNLAGIYYRLGKRELSIRHCAEALRLKPDYVMAATKMAQILSELGRIHEALEYYYRVLQLRPDQVDILNDLAWILAAAGDINLQNPDKAVKFAEKACELTNYEDPGFLDTLAVGYAAAGRFDRAVETARKAVKLAEAADKQDLADEIRKRLMLFNARQPYVEAPQAQDNVVP